MGVTSTVTAALPGSGSTSASAPRSPAARRATGLVQPCWYQPLSGPSPAARHQIHSPVGSSTASATPSGLSVTRRSRPPQSLAYTWTGPPRAHRKTARSGRAIAWCGTWGAAWRKRSGQLPAALLVFTRVVHLEPGRPTADLRRVPNGLGATFLAWARSVHADRRGGAEHRATGRRQLV